jgi:hypothetical protein
MLQAAACVVAGARCTDCLRCQHQQHNRRLCQHNLLEPHLKSLGRLQQPVLRLLLRRRRVARLLRRAHPAAAVAGGVRL